MGMSFAFRYVSVERLALAEEDTSDAIAVVSDGNDSKRPYMHENDGSVSRVALESCHVTGHHLYRDVQSDHRPTLSK